MAANLTALYAVLNRADTETALVAEIENAVAALTKAELDSLPGPVLALLYDYDSQHANSVIWQLVQDIQTPREYEEII